MIKVAIVEDDKDIRTLTARLLNLYDDIECHHVFPSAEAFQTALPLDIDVVLVDIGLDVAPNFAHGRGVVSTNGA